MLTVDLLCYSSGGPPITSVLHCGDSDECLRDKNCGVISGTTLRKVGLIEKILTVDSGLRHSTHPAQSVRLTDA